DKAANLLADAVALAPQPVAPRLGFAIAAVQVNHLVYQRQLLVLKLLANVFLDLVGMVAKILDVQHAVVLLLTASYHVSDGKKGASPAMGRKLRVATQIAGNPAACPRDKGRALRLFAGAREVERRSSPPARTDRRLSVGRRTSVSVIARRL